MGMLQALKDDAMNVVRRAETPLHADIGSLIHRLISYIESVAPAVGAAVGGAIGGPVGALVGAGVTEGIKVEAPKVEGVAGKEATATLDSMGKEFEKL
jgi:hypothetical protein